MSGEQLAADMATRMGNQRRRDEEQLTLFRAMLRVVIDGQAWLYANQLLPANAAEEDYEKLMTEWKQKSADLVEEILAGTDEE